MTPGEPKCCFCTIPNERVILANEYACVVEDGFPVTKHHSLVIPKRHVEDYFELKDKELLACDSLLNLQKDKMIKMDSSIKGFNIGINCGEVAGQTIFHCHIHLIPRREGDVANPKGGVRHVIPEKGYY
jgi:ATP adenylyltransferase